MCSISPNCSENLVIANDTEDGRYSTAMYYCIGIFLFIIIICAQVQHVLIILTFVLNKHLRTADNVLIIGLSVSDLCIAVVPLPLVGISSIAKRWIFGGDMCIAYAYFTTAFGLTQITLLTLISMDRYLIIVKSRRLFTTSKFSSVFMIAASFCYGFFFASGPLFGWSSYSLERVGIACSVNWEDRRPEALSYTFTLMTFCWFLPMIVLCFCYWTIAHTVCVSSGRFQGRRIRKHSREQKIACTVFLMTCAFVLTWLPYSIIALVTPFVDIDKIASWIIIVPAVIAKCSIVWNPIIYIFRHKAYRNGLGSTLKHILNGGKCTPLMQVRQLESVGSEYRNTDNELAVKQINLTPLNVGATSGGSSPITVHLSGTTTSGTYV